MTEQSAPSSPGAPALPVQRGADELPAPAELPRVIRTPDRRLRVFISSTIGEMAPERLAARAAISRLGLVPIFFEAGARPHPPRELYRAYLAQSDVFVGLYWERYGWVAPGETISGLEDEYRLSGGMPKLIYIKHPAPGREDRLGELLHRIQADDQVSYQRFATPEELSDLLQDDLAVLLTERFETVRRPSAGDTGEAPTAAPAKSARRREPRPLPVPLTPLVGRRREVAEVIDLLRRDDARLVTLTGPGGIGKSRIALEVAHRLEDAFPDGVWLAPLNDVREVDLVPSALAQALRVDERPGQATLDVLAEELRDARMLVVVDGFEQILSAAAHLAELLLACPTLTMLVTSRAVLNLRAERDYPVPPLPLPARDQDTDPGDIARTEAVQLFAATAAAAVPGFEITPDNAADVAAICRRLDGLPLAIELAAARVRLLPPAALLGRLSSRLDLLTGGAADLPARHQTLRAALAWDYDLLDGEERALFRRLAVCERGFGLEMAEAVADAAGGLGIDVLDGLDSLVGKSLVRREHADGPGDRFTMLETIREYAVEHLVDSGEVEQVRAAHAAFLLDFLAQADIRGADQVRWLDEIEREHANIRAALRWAIANDDVTTELAIVARMSRFWRLHGHLVEGSRWVTGTLERTGDVETPERLQLLIGAAQFPRARGDLPEAQRLLETARDMALRIGDRHWLAHAHRDLGAIYGESANLDAARDEALLALPLFEELGDEVGVAHTLNSLGVDAELRKDFDRAAHYYSRAIAMLLRLHDATGVALLLMNLACVLTAQGRPADALRLLVRSLGLWRHLDNAWYASDTLETLAYAVADLGETETAVRLLGTAHALRDSLGVARAPFQEPEYDARVAAMRAALTEQRFAVAWHAGEGTSMGHAVDTVAAAYGVEDLLDGAPGEIDDALLGAIGIEGVTA